MKIGVLALQGAVSEHLDMLKACGVEGVRVRHQKDFHGLQGLIIPGGESTTIGRLIHQLAIREPIEELIALKKPLFGTCAGLVLLGREVEGCPEQQLLGCMDTVVVRNGFGRQRESFEKDMDLPFLGKGPFPGVFIRAPYIARAGEGVETLGILNDKIIIARQGNVLVAAFHPELTTDVRLHHYFLEMT
jgi:pyridoxal 5'-phosphate synthase pdxT subunit